MKRIRTFLAVDVGGSIRDRASQLQRDWQQVVPSAKWVKPENMHITVLFLGDLDDNDIFQLCRSAGRIAKKTPAFTVSCQTVGAFPNLRRPKVLWVGVGEGLAELVQLNQQLKDAISESGIRFREERDLTPHLTLGRIDEDEQAPTDWSELFQNYRTWNGGRVAIRELLIMGSELRRSGPEYSVLGRVELGGEDD